LTPVRLSDTAQAMSKENVEIVERAVAAVNERDIDAYLACVTEDIEISTPIADFGGVYEGPDGIRRFFADLADTSPDFRISIVRLELIGAKRVLAYTSVTARGRSSDIDIGMAGANIYDFANGRIKRVRIFLDRDQALEAAGLSE
jgi:hypothetical protein